MSLNLARLIALTTTVTDPFRIQEAAAILLGRINASHGDIKLATDALARIER